MDGEIVVKKSSGKEDQGGPYFELGSTSIACLASLARTLVSEAS